MRVMIDLLREIRYVWRLFTLGLVIYLLAAAANQLAPLILQGVIDGPLTNLGQGLPFDRAIFLRQMMAYGGLLLLGSVLSFVGNRFLMHSGTKMVENMRNRAYDIMQNLPISYFDDQPAGKIATRIVNDTETLRQQFFSTLIYIFTNIARLVFTYAIIFYMNVELGLVLLLLLPAFYGLQHLYGKLTNQSFKDFYEARSQVNVQVNETMNGASLIQLYGQEEAVMADFYQAAQKMQVADNRVNWANSVASWPLTEFAKNIVVAAILTIVGLQFLDGRLGVSAGFLFITLNYIIDIFDYLGMLVRELPNLKSSMETGNRVLDLLQEQQESDQSSELQVTAGRIVFDQVGFAYEKDKPVLSDISFAVNEGETLALVGHTGSGKSSIMNLLYRFYDADSGKITIDGQDIKAVSRESLRSQMGIVLQDPYLFTGTIASNVAMDADTIDRRAVTDALEKVGAGPLLARLDKGIDEPVVEKGASFSSGERQLIAFARTLYANPKILILDEATSHIDTETEDIIQKAMEVVQEGRTTLIIAHRLSTIQHADQILVLEAGHIIERGNHETLIVQGGTYAHMHQLQQEV